MTKTQIVVGVSVGTGLLLAAMVFAISVAIVLSGAVSNAHLPVSTPPTPVFVPQDGLMGELNRLKNDIKYGPVNMDAATEKKDGIISRIRDRVEARSQAYCQNVVQSACRPVQQQSYCQPQQAVYYKSQPAFVSQSIILDPSDCNTSYVLSQPTTRQVILQPTGVNEYPSVPALNRDCPTCPKLDPDISQLFNAPRVDKRNEIKTGEFCCANCRRKAVGADWHTDWSRSGMPVTFLCEACYRLMTPAQRTNAYQQYAGRQIKKSGSVGLMHPETY